MTQIEKWHELKAVDSDTILIVKMGNFYELFGNDADQCSELLDRRITYRHPPKMEALKMIGFPYHELDANILKLVQSGKRVAVLEMQQ